MKPGNATQSCTTQAEPITGCQEEHKTLLYMEFYDPI